MINVRLRHSIIIFANLLIVLMLTLSFSNSIATKEPANEVLSNSIKTFTEPNYTDELVQSTASEVNLLRKNSGLNELSASSELDRIAQLRAISMTEHKYYSHIAPDGKDFADLLNESNATYKQACENLNTNEDATADKYVETWLTSTTGHRECMLGQSYSKAGYAIADIVFQGSSSNQKVIVAIYSN